MNVRILNASRKKPCPDSFEKLMFEELKDGVCFIPSVVIGEPMIVMYSNARTVRHRSSEVLSLSFDSSTGVYSIETADASYSFADLEYNRKKRKKRIASTLYMESRIRHMPLRTEKDPDGHLFADGRYATMIYASDLPEHFVYGYLYKRHGFVSAAGVKHMLYVPNYIFNHRHKYDSLYISYDEPIKPAACEHGLVLYEGAEHTIDGSLIIDFVDAAEKYSGYDVSEIRREIQRKSDWFDEKYGKE